MLMYNYLTSNCWLVFLHWLVSEVFSVLLQCTMSGRFTPSTVLLPQTNIDAYPFSAHNGLLRSLPFTLFCHLHFVRDKTKPSDKAQADTLFLSCVRRTAHSVTTLASKHPKALPPAFWMSELTRADPTFTPIWANTLNQAAPLDSKPCDQTCHTKRTLSFVRRPTM